MSIRPSSGRMIPSAALLLLLLAPFALVAAACSDDGGSDASGERVLTVGIPGAPKALDPAKDVYTDADMWRFLTNETLTVMNPDGSIGPGLATEFHYSAGNTVFEFTLREDAKFSDGTPLNAEAVKGWFEYFAKAGGPFASELPIKSIETLDEWTVRINLSAAAPTLPLLLSGFNNHGFVSSVKDPSALAQTSVGVGPYRLDPSRTVADDHYTLVPNDNYYDKSAAKWDEIVMKVISNPSTMLQAVQAGQVDVAVGDLSTASAAKSAGVNVYTGIAGTASILFLDRAGSFVKPLGDVRVRQAINYAIDRSAITTGLVGDLGTPTSQVHVPDGYDESYADYYDYDPEKAKQLLAEAGYPNGFEFSVVNADPAAGARGKPLLQAVAKYLEAVGIKLDVVAPATTGEAIDGLVGKKFQGMLLGFRNASTVQVYNQFLAGDGSANFLGAPADPTLEKLANEASTASDDEVPGYLKQMLQRTVTEAYIVPVFTFPTVVFASDDVQGITNEGISQSLYRPIMKDWVPN